MVFPDDTYTPNTQQALLELQRLGFTKMRLTNYFLDKNPTFHGVSAVLATDNQFHFTVQFHTPTSYQIKLATHDIRKNNQQETRQPHPNPQHLQNYRHLLQQHYQPHINTTPENIHHIHNFTPHTQP
jgi:hypothetical protein